MGLKPQLTVKEKSKSTLFLIEQIIVIAVFAICAAICVRIIVSAYLMTADAVDTRNALTLAESAAESFKALDGDAALIHAVLSELGGVTGSFTPNEISIVCEDFALLVTIRDASRVIFADITVSRADGGDELVTLTVATRTGGAN